MDEGMLHLARTLSTSRYPAAPPLIHLHLACATTNLKVVDYLGQVKCVDKIGLPKSGRAQDGMWSPESEQAGLGLELNPEAVEKVCGRYGYSTRGSCNNFLKTYKVDMKYDRLYVK